MIKKFLPLFLLTVFFSFAATSCKSKQKITEIPGATIPATKTTTSTVTTPNKEVVTTPVKEETRSESFKLASGETNTAALSFKYHVVVGSFSVHTNAVNLRNKLANEGNNSLTVENEKGMLRVIISSFNDYNDAHGKIKQIKSSYPDAWVLVQK
jgi:cell division protein FtsN